MSIKYISTILFYLLSTSFFFAQDSVPNKDLMERVIENMQVINTNPEEGIQESINIESEARRRNDREVECFALVNQCVYYRVKVDFENLSLVANTLYDRGKEYNMPNYQAIGKFYLFKSYFLNDMSERAFVHLEEGRKYLARADKEGKSTVGMKTNFYIGYADYFYQQKDYTNQLKYIKLSGAEVDKLPEGRRKEELRHLNYSNLAEFYLARQQLDSASYYAHLSNNVGKSYHFGYIEFVNLTIIGEVAFKNEEYSQAVFYFEKAEKIEGLKSHNNLLKLYDNMILSYQKLGFRDSAELYQSKKDSLRLKISENQNKFLRNLLDGIETFEYRTILYLVFVILVLMSILVFFVIRKNRILVAQEKISEQYLESNKTIANDHLRLIELVKENNPAFMKFFEEVHPEFTQKLLELTPKISHSDVEFCALLKLRIPTKEIAKYRFLAPKTVQNKRYIIRKKLGIPKDVDTYHWFESF